MYRNIPSSLITFLFFLLLPLLQNCNTPPDVPRADSSDQKPLVYPVKGVNQTPIQSVSSDRNNGSGSFVYQDDEVTPSQLTSLHHRLHGLDGRKDPLDDESIQSTNPNHVKGEQQKKKQHDQQQQNH